MAVKLKPISGRHPVAKAAIAAVAAAGVGAFLLSRRGRFDEDRPVALSEEDEERLVMLVEREEGR